MEYIFALFSSVGMLAFGIAFAISIPFLIWGIIANRHKNSRGRSILGVVILCALAISSHRLLVTGLQMAKEYQLLWF